MGKFTHGMQNRGQIYDTTYKEKGKKKEYINLEGQISKNDACRQRERKKNINSINVHGEQIVANEIQREIYLNKRLIF